MVEESRRVKKQGWGHEGEGKDAGDSVWVQAGSLKRILLAVPANMVSQKMI